MPLTALKAKAAHTIGALSRMVGPVSASSLFALSVGKHALGGQLVWVCFVILALGAAGTAWVLQEKQPAWRSAAQEEG
jgi:hypothetical protein